MSRITTTNEMVAAANGAEKLHQWPSEVGLGPDISAMNVYNKAQLQRAYRDWTPIDLVELARASKLIALVDIEFEKYIREGVVIMGGRHGTTPMENPRGRAVSTMNSTINSMLRRIGLTSMSVADKRSQANRGQQERDMRDADNSRDDDDMSLIN